MFGLFLFYNFFDKKICGNFNKTFIFAAILNLTFHEKILHFLFLISYLAIFQSNAQQCATLGTNTPNIYQDTPFARSLDQGATFCINIKIHIVRNTDGSNGFGGTPSTSPNFIISKLNENFNPHGIYLNLVGVEEIDNSNFLYIDGTSELNNLFSTNDNPNAINYYVVDRLFINGDFASGVAASVGSNKVAVAHHRIYAPESSHEVGHALDLHHTFRGSSAETNGCAENINGSNCRDCGDLVCDTPADTNDVDDNGYSPDLTNIMSYYYPKDHFTSGQGFRMRQALRYNSTLQNVVSNTCQFDDLVLDGGDTLCFNQEKTFTLLNVPNGANVFWTASTNLTVVNNSGNAITVKLNSPTTEVINITARMSVNNGSNNFYSKDLVLLPMPSASHITLESFRSEPILLDRWTNITAKYNGLITLFTPHQRFEWEWVTPSHLYRQNSIHYSYIHVKPIVTNMPSVYIQTRVKNECGCSDWKGKWFVIEEPPVSGCNTCPTTGGEIHY